MSTKNDVKDNNDADNDNKDQPKKLISLRLKPEIAEWSLKYMGEGRTAFIEMLFKAIMERRLILTAAPATFCVNDGVDVRNPVLVCMKGK